MMSDNDVIHVALAFCDPKGTYARHAAVTMASIYENAQGRRVDVHILHDNTFTPGNQKNFKLLSQGYAQSVYFHNVEDCFSNLNVRARNLAYQGYRGMMYRLFIPDLLMVDKVIYLDCDIVVNMDLSELWKMPLGNYSIGAVRDFWALEHQKGNRISWRLKKAWGLLDIKPESYFNSGVLLLNLKTIRSKYNLLVSLVQFFEEYRSCVTLPDQDFLNWLFVDDKVLLDERFNHIDASGVTKETLQGSIWHMAGGSAKPWSSYTRPLVDDLYWHYLRFTPYCRDENDLIHMILQGMSSSPLMHLHSSDCVTRLLKQLEDDIFRAHIWTIPPILWKVFLKRLSRLKGRRQ